MPPTHVEDVTSARDVKSSPEEVTRATNGDEKMFDDEIQPADGLVKASNLVHSGAEISQENKVRLMQYYGRKAEEEDIAPSRDVQLIMDRIIEMNEEEAVEVLVEALDFHKIDPNFPAWTMAKLKELVQGYKACGMSEEDWSFDVKTEAAMLKYHSPYPEVRSVTDPFDDPTEAVETIRAYILGFCFMAGSTALNTFFSPRQPAISLSAIVMQLLLAPCGWAWAKVVPNWHVKIWKWQIPLNHGYVNANQ